MQKLIIIVCLLIQIPSVWAISNIENERPNLPEQGFSGSLKLGVDGKTGNQKEQSSEGAIKLIYRNQDEIFLVLASGEYGSKHDVKDTDNNFLHTRWTHLLNEQWAIEGFAQWEKDEFDNLTSRVLAGSGARYVISQQKDVYSLAIGGGVFREYEKQNLVTYEETNRLWRINTYYAYKYQINEQLSFINTTYFQPSTNHWDDFRVLFDMAMDVTLIKRLHLVLSYRLTHDSQPAKNLAVTPPINNYQTNSEYKTALSFSF